MTKGKHMLRMILYAALSVGSVGAIAGDLSDDALFTRLAVEDMDTQLRVQNDNNAALSLCQDDNVMLRELVRQLSAERDSHHDARSKKPWEK